MVDADTIVDTIASERDKELIDKIAKKWIKQGGNAEDVFCLWPALHRRVKELGDAQ